MAGEKNDHQGRETGEIESKLLKVLQDDTENDPEGVLYAVLETIEEIQTYVQVNNVDPSQGDDGEEFQASSELPASSAIGGEGYSFTAAEVSVPVSEEITRNEQSIEALEDAVQQDNTESRRHGLRLRKREKKGLQDQEKSELAQVEGIFGTTVKPSKWSLNNYLQSLGSTREKRFVALSAWLLSLIGLIVALVFVTKDFIESREEQSTTVRYEDSPSLDLPSLWLCTADSEVPPFVNLPNEEYIGKPLVWIDYLRGTSSEINVTYPETKALNQLSVGSFDVMGKQCNASRAMNPLTYFQENTAKPSCFYCLMINRNPPLTIRKDGETNEGVTSSTQASLRISQHASTSQCRSSQFGLSGIMLRFFREELKANHAALSARGILDFGEQDPSNSTHDSLLWPDYRLGFQNNTVDFVIYDIVDMFCNVYLFSDFFYPSTSKDVKYKFNSRVFRWERSGKGPYYPDDYFVYYTQSENVVLYTGNAVIGDEKYDNRSAYDSSTIQVRTDLSKIGGAETLAILEASEIASIELSRNVIKERECYTSQVLRTKLLAGDIRSLNNVYFVDVGFKTFLTRVVSGQQSVSWSAFIADFFGLTSLFMDVSVYTIIVAPIVMRGRRRALRARTQRLQVEGDV